MWTGLKENICEGKNKAADVAHFLFLVKRGKSLQDCYFENVQYAVRITPEYSAVSAYNATKVGIFVLRGKTSLNAN